MTKLNKTDKKTRWRGYVISTKNPFGRQAMRVGKTHKTKAEAIKYVKEKTNDHMRMNFPERNKGFKFNAYKVKSDNSFKFPAGRSGNKKLLDWHDKTRLSDGYN